MYNPHFTDYKIIFEIFINFLQFFQFLVHVLAPMRCPMGLFGLKFKLAVEKQKKFRSKFDFDDSTIFYSMSSTYCSIFMTKKLI